MITLYGFPHSRSVRVSWTLEELGLDWQSHHVDFNQGEHKSPEFLAVNPCGKVPALDDNGLVIIESAAICHYLAEKYGNGKLLPKPGSEQAAKYQQWFSYIISELEQPLWVMGKHKFALPEPQRVPEMQATAKWEFDKAANLANDWLPSSEFLLGSELTVVDILLAHTLNWAVNFEQTLPDKLNDYRKRVSARPTLQSALAKEKAAQAEKQK